MAHPQCALGRVQINEMDAEQVKRDGWQKQRILVVAEDDRRLDFVERELVRQIGDRLYGETRRGA